LLGRGYATISAACPAEFLASLLISINEVTVVAVSLRAEGVVSGVGGMPGTGTRGVGFGLTRISHKISTAAAQTGMSTALRSVGLLDVLSSTSAGPSVALAEMRQMRLVSTPSAPPRYETL